MVFRKIVLSISLAIAVCSQWSLPAHGQQSGRDVVQELVTLMSAMPKNNRRHNIYDAAAKRIDYNTMTELCFTPGQWDSFTPAQKKEIVREFQTLVENRYYERWHKLFLHAKLKIDHEARAGGDFYVKTFLVEGDDQDTVIWRLRLRSGDPMIIGMNVNGKDLQTRLSDRFQKQLKKRGPQGLIAWMKSKADEADEIAEESRSDGRRAANK